MLYDIVDNQLHKVQFIQFLMFTLLLEDLSFKENCFWKKCEVIWNDLLSFSRGTDFITWKSWRFALTSSSWSHTESWEHLLNELFLWEKLQKQCSFKIFCFWKIMWVMLVLKKLLPSCKWWGGCGQRTDVYQSGFVHVAMWLLGCSVWFPGHFLNCFQWFLV